MQADLSSIFDIKETLGLQGLDIENIYQKKCYWNLYATAQDKYQFS